ncbi:hypothetical protein RhiXN_08494 [Rhizoctonia solani]|uniref:Uncharacterized protein n=1 Tax=Rhizoctonia solani TaxID=456999 RepID=A0A8H8T0H4_9AGAM|nr:uncharacterized protein RhiXN_08494 [Rhizoctonia solani]QRW23458.1 hypothetical protein RhiXN_08494 [Rhizoctonia solani]
MFTFLSLRCAKLQGGTPALSEGPTTRERDKKGMIPIPRISAPEDLSCTGQNSFDILYVLYPLGHRLKCRPITPIYTMQFQIAQIALACAIAFGVIAAAPIRIVSLDARGGTNPSCGQRRAVEGVVIDCI